MKEFIEKLIGRLEEIPVENRCCECPHRQKCDEVQENINNEHTDLCGATIKALAVEIINQLAEEHNNGWIPCSEVLPEVSGEYYTYVYYDGHYMHSVDEIDCDGMIKKWNCASDYQILAWKPVAPYQPKGE